VDEKTEPTPKNPKGFDPFAAEPTLNDSSKWFWAMTLQAIITTVCLVGFWLAQGHSMERTIRLVLLIGIASTWSLALRTIRERLVELMRHWHKASHGLLKKCSESGRHWISVPCSQEKERYIKSAIWKLRIIAAGLTIPFFVMPFVFSFVAIIHSFTDGPILKEFWAGVAMVMMIGAAIVAGYLHWVLLPKPVRVTAFQRRYFPQRNRRRF
jgi:hypothetical protein